MIFIYYIIFKYPAYILVSEYQIAKGTGSPVDLVQPSLQNSNKTRGWKIHYGVGYSYHIDFFAISMNDKRMVPNSVDTMSS